MATTFNWAAWTARSGIVTTQLDSIATGGYTAVSAAYDNTANLDQWMALDFVLGSFNPTAGGYLQVFLTQSLDGTTYEDPPSSTNPGYHMSVATMSLTTGASAKRVMTPPFRIPAGKFKFVFLQAAGATSAATGNSVTPYTTDEKGN